MKNTQNFYCLDKKEELWLIGRFDSYEAAEIAAQEQGHEVMYLLNEIGAKRLKILLESATA